MGKMNAGDVPQNASFYVEEARNLVGKKNDDNTWPRIAKEGAEAKIAALSMPQEHLLLRKHSRQYGKLVRDTP